MMVWLNACPMCSVPVTLGGGSWMAKFSPRAAASALAAPVPRQPARPRPACSQAEPHWDSMAAGSKDLDSAARRGCSGVADMAWERWWGARASGGAVAAETWDFKEGAASGGRPAPPFGPRRRHDVQRLAGVGVRQL